jgi:hypothetical protein
MQYLHGGLLDITLVFTTLHPCLCWKVEECATLLRMRRPVGLQSIANALTIIGMNVRH